VAVTQGYIGSDAAGASTTLGRGGSDYSASLLGAAVDAAEIQIWTDVEGVLTCDPRIVPEARPVEILGYDEAAELAAFGAKVLHPSTILPAVERGIPVTVRNSLVPEGRFTTISREAASGRPVTALASRGPVTVITVRTPRMLGGAGFLARIFEVFGRKGVSVDLVSTSEVSISVTVGSGAPADEIAGELAHMGEVRVERDRAVVALVGEQLRRTPGVAGRAFGALCDINVEMISLGANEINLSLVVKRDKEVEVLRRLHAAFFDEAGAEAGLACADQGARGAA
jgi:aspartate kinase